MEKFEMVAKTFAGLEEVLAEELRNLGAENVEPGRRMVSFEGDLEMLYKANLCCRTALRILKPFYKFTAHTPDELYEQTKEFDWSTILSLDKTFCIDTVAYSEDFTHSHFVTYRVKDAIVDWFRDKYDQRPGVRLKDADVMINVHIAGGNVTLSLDSSGESLHKRGYRVAQTEAPINEVLAAGIILMSGWRGDCPLIDPMCGSGTFLIEAALIAANINPGIYRKSFAFENWPDFDAELFENLYNNDEEEREIQYPIIGADILPEAIEISKRNIKSAGVSKYIELMVKPIAKWEDAPNPAGVIITNPPYGQRISVPDMEGLYETIGNRLKRVFQGYHAWIIGYNDEYFQKIGLAPSKKVALFNGSLECELREYIIFDGDKKTFLASGGKLKQSAESAERSEKRSPRRFSDDEKRGERRPRRFSDDEKRVERSPRRFSDEEKRGERRPRRFSDEEKRGERSPRRFSDEEKRGERSSRRFSDEEKRGERSPRRFSDEEKRGERSPRRFSDEEKKFSREAENRNFPQSEKMVQEASSDNPLAKRRNPNALKMLTNKLPSLPPQEGPIMRTRGWRKKK